MYYVELLVRLKIPDVTALTASNSLRRRMGYAKVMTELKRADYYLLEIEAETAEDAELFVYEIAEQTSLFVNPNKHAFEVRVKGTPSDEKPEPGLFEVNVLVRDVEGDKGPGLRDTLVRLGYVAVQSVQAQTMWILKIRADDVEAAKKGAEEIAVTTSRSKGLLGNPHYQQYTVTG